MKKNKRLSSILKRKFVAPMASRIEGFDQWSNTATGKAFLEVQKSIVDEKVETLFGYHLMQLSAVNNVNLLEKSKVRHRFTVSRRQDLPADMYCDERHLALTSDSVDVSILHHVLDYSKNPHELLREASRVTLPSGHLLIVGFNPKSFFLPMMLLGRFFKKPVWQTQFLTASRLADWLTVLGFSIETIDYGYYQLPLKQPVAAGLFNKLECFCRKHHISGGAFYVIVACKNVSTITPIKTRKKLVPSIVGASESTAFKGNKKQKIDS